MRTTRALRCALFAALFLLTSVLVVDTALADVPIVNSVKPWTRASDNHAILNITITHRNYYAGHYVDSMQVDIDGAVDTVNLSPPQPVNQPFVAEYDMGVVLTNPTVRARAHCTLHGSSGWSAPVQIGGDGDGDGGDGGDGGTRVGGLFNPNATLSADFTLLLQIVIFVVLLAGFVMARVKRSFLRHGVIMGVAVVLHTISILIVMMPSLLSSGGLFENWAGSLPLAVASHAALGILVEILGAYLVLIWALHPKDAQSCLKRKTAMRVVLVSWLIELILGAYVYILLYVPL
jgi:uncharacterized membrane protein YozB (DUF420 family)